MTAGKYKRTLTPFKKLEAADLAKTKEEVGEIFTLFKAFVGKHRPCLDIDAVATGETWFGEDAVERKLCDELRTIDDVLLELHSAGVELYAVEYEPQAPSPFERLGLAPAGAAGLGAHSRGRKQPAPNWAARALAAALGLPLETEHMHTPPMLQDPRGFTGGFTGGYTGGHWKY